jgi:hypothetical protein
MDRESLVAISSVEPLDQTITPTLLPDDIRKAALEVELGMEAKLFGQSRYVGCYVWMTIVAARPSAKSNKLRPPHEPSDCLNDACDGDCLPTGDVNRAARIFVYQNGQRAPDVGGVQKISLLPTVGAIHGIACRKSSD